MTASVAAHALVVALLAMTWREETLVEGGTPGALVSIDLSAQEGAKGPKTAAPVEAEAPTPAPTPPSAVQAPERPVEPRPLPVPAPSAPQPRDQALRADHAGGGEGRTGQGTASATTGPTPAPTSIPARILVSSATLIAAAASTPPRRVEGQDRGADARGTGGTGGGRSGMDGNAAASNYKGQVYQHLLRHRQTNTIGAGKVLIAFTVEPGGTARDLAVARSSGLPRFDREALQLVRRAAPFPRPPDGAAHSFTFEITGQ